VNIRFVYGEFHFRFGRRAFKQGRSHLNNNGWVMARLIVYDNAGSKEHKVSFEERYRTLHGGITRYHPFIAVASAMKCKSVHHIHYLVYTHVVILLMNYL
jgi:hypothetical protein